MRLHGVYQLPDRSRIHHEEIFVKAPGIIGLFDWYPAAFPDLQVRIPGCGMARVAREAARLAGECFCVEGFHAIDSIILEITLSVSKDRECPRRSSLSQTCRIISAF